MRTHRNLGLATAVAMILGSVANAADVSPLIAPATPAEEGEDWSFAASPYFWGASLSGKTSQFGLPEIKIDSSFSDILENLDFAFMAAAELRYERFSTIGDVMYTKLSSDADTPIGLLTKEVDVQAETAAGLIGAGYAVIGGPQGRLDVVGGRRAWWVDTTISFNGGVLDGRSRKDGATWVDGIVGLRGKYNPTSEWSCPAGAWWAPAVPKSIGMWPPTSATSSTTQYRRWPVIGRLA